jgi:hypothetical protein
VTETCSRNNSFNYKTLNRVHICCGDGFNLTIYVWNTQQDAHSEESGMLYTSHDYEQRGTW